MMRLLCAALMFFSVEPVVRAQESIEFLAGGGFGSAQYHWPHGSVDSEFPVAHSMNIGIRAKTEINEWLSLGSEIGILKVQAYPSLEFTGSTYGNPYTAETSGVIYRQVNTYLYVFPEFHPFPAFRNLYFRAFPLIKMAITDEYGSTGGFSGFIVNRGNGSVYSDHDVTSTWRHHPLIFFGDVGYTANLSSRMALIVELRMIYIPRSRYHKYPIFGNALDYPDNSFFLGQVNLGMSYLF